MHGDVINQRGLSVGKVVMVAMILCKSASCISHKIKSALFPFGIPFRLPVIIINPKIIICQHNIII